MVCAGSKFLVRFVMAYNEDQPVFERAPPAGAELASLPIRDPSACRLTDGREVRLKHVDEKDARPYGACGADNSHIFSLWLGGRKLYSRARQRGKCNQPYGVRAIYFDGRKLTECRLVAESPSDDGPTACLDANEHLAQSPSETRRPGVFALSTASTEDRPFCLGLVRNQRPGLDMNQGPVPWSARAEWPKQTARPYDYPEAWTRLQRLAADGFDLDNDGRKDRVIQVEGDGGFFDGVFWVVAAPTLTSAQAAALRDKLAENPSDEVEKARRSGFKVFAGDQSAYGEPRYVTLSPFFKNRKTWLHARWTHPRMELPTELVLEPLPSGRMRTVCVFEATPAL